MDHSQYEPKEARSLRSKLLLSGGLIALALGIFAMAHSCKFDWGVGTQNEDTQKKPLPASAETVSFKYWNDAGTMVSINGVIGVGSVLLAPTNMGYVLVSQDEGNTWTVSSVTEEIVTLRDAAVLADGRWAVLDEKDSSLWVSRDKGKTWKPTPMTLRKNGQQTPVEKLRMTASGLLLRVLPDEPEAHSERHLLSADLGRTWKSIGRGLPNVLNDGASATSSTRATLDPMRKLVDQFIDMQAKRFVESIAGPQAESAPGSYGAMRTMMENRYRDEDRVYDASLQHWLDIKDGVVRVSHDGGNTFTVSKMSPPLPGHTSTGEEDHADKRSALVVFASTLASGGKTSVVAFGPEPSGSRFDEMPFPTDFHFYLSTDGGVNYQAIPKTVSAYDVGGVWITNEAKGEFIVLHDRRNGFSFYQNQTFTSYFSNDYGNNSAATTNQGIFIAGNRLFKLRDGKATRLTSKLTTPACRPDWVLSDEKLEKMFGVSNSGSLAFSEDGGSTWLITRDAGNQWVHLASNELPELKRLALSPTASTSPIGDNYSEKTSEESLQDRIGDAVLMGDTVWIQIVGDLPNEESNSKTQIKTVWVRSIDHGRTWSIGPAPGEAGVHLEHPLQTDSIERGGSSRIAGGSEKPRLMHCSVRQGEAGGDCLSTYGKGSKLFLSNNGSKVLIPLIHPYAGEIRQVMISSNGQRLLAVADAGILVSHDRGKSFDLVVKPLQCSSPGAKELEEIRGSDQHSITVPTFVNMSELRRMKSRQQR